MAREHPRYANMEFPEYEFRDFPKMYYPGAKDQKKPYDSKGRPLRGVRVENEDELRTVMGMAAPEDEASRKPMLVTEGNVSRLKTVEDERAELIDQLTVRGITFDKRWGLAKLQDALDGAEVV